MVNENQTLVLGSARGARCVVRDFHRADRIGGRPGHHAPPRPLIIRRNRYSHPAGTGSRRHPPTTSRCSDLATDATGCRNTGTAPSMRLLPSRTKCIGYCRVRRRANIHDRKNTETRPPCRGRLRAKRNFPNRSRRGKSRSPTSPDPALRRMVDRIDKAMKGRRSLESALAELEGKYQMRPSAELARMMEQLKAEIAIRKRRPNRQPG